VTVDGVAIDGIKGSTIFNEDGSINYDAEKNFHGNKTTIFPQGADGTYELVIHASGYTDVTVTVGKDSAITPPETPDQTPEATAKKLAKVTKASISAVTKTSMKVTWKKVSGATGYQIRYSKKSTLKNAKTVNVKTVSKKLTKLTKKTKYYVQVRAYKTATVNGEKTTIYGNWSATKTATTK
jgi:ABC-type Na+ efflux pump permease subunit